MQKLLGLNVTEFMEVKSKDDFKTHCMKHAANISSVLQELSVKVVHYFVVDVKEFKLSNLIFELTFLPNLHYRREFVVAIIQKDPYE